MDFYFSNMAKCKRHVYSCFFDQRTKCGIYNLSFQFFLKRVFFYLKLCVQDYFFMKYCNVQKYCAWYACIHIFIDNLEHSYLCKTLFKKIMNIMFSHLKFDYS